MKKKTDIVTKIYDRYILARPGLVIILLLIVISILGYRAKDFKIDASAESLFLENDTDLRYSREVNLRYGVNNFLLISYTPKDGNLFSDKTLEQMKRLRDELSSMKFVSSVISILDVPLLESPPVPYDKLSENIPNLQSPGIDKRLARIEFEQSPFYNKLLVSMDMKTTALIANLKPVENYQDIVKKRDELRLKKAGSKLSKSEAEELENVTEQIRKILNEFSIARHQNITTVRKVMDKYRDHAELFLGGINMIADDMISFIKNDLKLFGSCVFGLLVIMLGLIFKKLRWIILPMLCCFFSVLAMMGILGMFGWEVTVISSNFISLQLIITLAIVIHLIVRYRELIAKNPDADSKTLILETVRTKITPCLYAALTTIAGFSSLMLCDILPVIHFGWMMSAGIVLSLFLTFILFPAGLMLLKKDSHNAEPRKIFKFSITAFFAKFTEANGKLILVVTAIVFTLSVMGMSRLVVENSFIDYFKKSTEIYQGMKVIDQKLGGTTPLDVILEFDDIEQMADESETDEYEDDFDDPYADTADDPFADPYEKEDTEKYWFTDENMETVERVHDYLDNLPETGKVLSLGVLLKIARRLNKGITLDSYELSILYTKLPEKFKKIILMPFVSIKENEVRFSVRIKDSLKNLKRDALLKQIKSDMVNNLELKEDKVHLAGAMVLYNNMLQSLFKSQVLTLGLVAFSLLFMFFILFRSIKVSLIALFPNLFASGSVLGVMGWMNIPLDMMTITIAAISIGIAVDNTIHYIHRFKVEIKKDNDYYKTLHRCHESIGHAMYYTSITIIIGFSVLALSNFLPSIYFGLFTGLAMLIALIAALTLLPQLIVLFKPFGSDSGEKYA
ncbi:MMPL family transporter [Desulfobacterales bacterium HSG16]|nr:MMPL family transporter [Desulfobacterales bacterium HSG16]